MNLKKKEKQTSGIPEASADDALFAALSAQKKKKKRKVIITVVIIVLVLAVAAVIAVSMLRKKVTAQFAASEDVKSYSASVGSISTSVSGSGTLANVDEETVSVPAGVEIKKVLVEANDTVEAGQPLATLNLPSVMSAMNSVQAELKELDEDLTEAASDAVSSSITAGVSGRVKKVFAQKGDSVAECMYKNGALALLSLDGSLAVDIPDSALISGESVTVRRADGTEIAGKVDTVTAGVATVLVSDNGPEVDEAVTVLNAEGSALGSGALYIHNALRVTGISGTVNAVYAAENRNVYSSTTLFVLTDTSYSANYEAILAQREEKEEELLDLMELYKNGAVLSPFAGSVSSVSYDEDAVTADAETEIAVVSPDESMSVTISVDESKILSLELGQTAQVKVSSLGDEYFSASVTEINKTATSSSGVTRYSAVITLDKRQGMLSGMSASVVIRIQGVDNAILIPVDALHQTSSRSYVYTSYDEDTHEYGGLREVTAGISNSNYVEITSGLAEGDTVYYTESSNGFTFGSMNFGGMPSGGFSGGGEMPSFGGSGEMPSFGGSERPNFGNMPSGGERPSFSGGMPSGGFPGGRN